MSYLCVDIFVKLYILKCIYKWKWKEPGLVQTFLWMTCVAINDKFHIAGTTTIARKNLIGSLSTNKQAILRSKLFLQIQIHTPVYTVNIAYIVFDNIRIFLKTQFYPYCIFYRKLIAFNFRMYLKTHILIIKKCN